MSTECHKSHHSANQKSLSDKLVTANQNSAQRHSADAKREKTSVWVALDFLKPGA